MKPDKSWEYGLEAECWHCDTKFTKLDYCEVCGFYKCPHCGKCACQLSRDARNVVEKTFSALAPILSKNAENRMGVSSGEH